MSHIRPRAFLGLGLAAATFAVVVSAQAQLKPQPGIALPPTVPGKDGKEKGKDDRDWNEHITLPVEREARNKIEAVNKYLNGTAPITPKLWEDIIAVLQGMLADPTDKFVEVSDGSGKFSKVSLKMEVNRIIGTFNDDGRQFYQRIVGPDAEDRVKRAIDDNDMQMMGEISQRFLHTKAGAEATIRLGNWHLDRGRYIQAAMTFKILQLRNPKDELPPELLFRAAIAFKRQSSDPVFAKQADEYWAKFEKATNKADFTIKSKTMKFADLKAEFDKTTGTARLPFTSEWGMFRGNPKNSEIGKGGTPFLEPRFTYNTLNPIDDFQFEAKKSGFEVLRDRLEKVMKLIDTKGQAAIPGAYPLASRDKVLFRGYDGVYCIATKDDKSIDPPIKAGEVLWKSDADFGLLQMLREMGPRATTDQWLNQYSAGGPFSMLIENPLLGTISHDGSSCYFVDDIAVPPHPSMAQQMAFNGMQVNYGQFTDAVHFSRLKAVNIETGKLIWKVGDRTPGAVTRPVGRGGFPGGGPVAIDVPAGTVQPQPKAEVPPGAPVKETTETLLSDCFFLGPPLPLSGKLYVVVEKEGELRLVCLDPNKLEPSTRQPTPVPTLVWTQKLGEPNGALPQDSLRRFQCLNLAYADGMLIVPTNAGAVLGIDLFSHGLVWAANYKSNKSLNQPMQDFEGGFRGRRPFPGNQANYDLARERWHASAPIIVGNRVVFTAFDSDTVECVDLHDGRPLWKNSITKQEADLYVAGVFDDKVMVVGKGYVRFHSLATGAQLKEPIPTGVPTGVGVATKDMYFVPIKATKDKSTEPGIIAIDTKNMMARGTSRSRKKETAGNLLFYDGDVYSLAPQGLAALPQLDIKIRETETRLAKNPLDPIGLLDLAMLQHDDGRLEPAIGTYRKCLENKPVEDTRAKAREKLFEAITELLQINFDSGEPMLAEYKKLCEVEIPAEATLEQRKLLAEEELRRKSNFFCLVAKGKEKQGKLLDAFENYMSFGTLVGNKEMVTVIDEPTTNARPDVWARGRIQNMIKKATPEQRKPLEEKVVTEWAKVKNAGDLDQLRGFVKVFGGMFDAGTDAKITLADRLAATTNEDDVREAEYMLLGLRDGEDASIAAKAVESLARLYIRKGLLDDAVGMYAELGKTYAKTVLRDGKTGADHFNDLITDKRFLPYLEPMTVTWPYQRLKGTEVTTGTYDTRANQWAVDPDGELLPFFRRNRLSLDQSGRSTQGWSLRVSDRVTGEERYNSPGMGYPQYQHMFLQNNIPMRLVQVKGHIAVVTMHGNHPQSGQQLARVTAFDVADKKKLWEVDLFGTNPNPLITNGGVINQAVEVDGIRIGYQDGWSTKIGQQWVVEATYTVVLTRDGLVAKDNARGTVLWTKSNMSTRTHMVGDAEHVFTFDCASDGNVSAVRCFRAADGVEVTVPDSSNAFTNIKKAKFYGRKVLAFDETAGKKSVRLYDLFKGTDVWKRDLGGDGWMLRTTDNAHTGFVTAGGDVVVLSTADGKEVFKSKLDEKLKDKHLEKVNDGVLFADQERFFVMLNRPSEANNRFGFQPIFTQSIQSVKVNGHMYAFDRATSKRLWYSDEQLVDQMIATNQFDELPIIMAASMYQKIAANGNFEGQFMKFAALDKATGKLKYSKTNVYQGQYYAIIADPKSGTLEILNHSGHRVRFVPDDGKTVGTTTPTTPPSSGTTPIPAIGIRQQIIVAPAVAIPVAPPVIIEKK